MAYDEALWQRYLEIKFSNPSTRQQYAGRIRQMQDSGLTAEEFILSGCSADTRNMRRNAVKHFRNFCQRERCLLPWFPAAGGINDTSYERITGSRASRQYISREDMERLLQAMRLRGRPREYMILLLSYAGGLRRSEIRRLTLDNIVLDVPLEGRSIIRVLNSKHGGSREVPLDSYATIRLVKYLVWRQKKYPNSRILIPGLKGLYYDGAFKRYHQELKACYEMLGLKMPARPSHNNRAMRATHLDEQGVSVRSIQALLGHENLNTTQVYLGMSTKRLSDELQAAAAPPDSHAGQSPVSREDPGRQGAAKTQHSVLSFPAGATRRQGS